MTGVEEERAWQVAFAREAASDLDVYELLCDQGSLPSCHRLHYLQMALEKMAKAYSWDPEQREGRSPRFAVSHAVASKVLPTAFKESWRATTPSRAPPRALMQKVRQFCREVELLAPAVEDAGRRPDNCEYPWGEADAGGRLLRVRVPVEHRFGVDDMARCREAKQVLKFVRGWLDGHR